VLTAAHVVWTEGVGVASDVEVQTTVQAAGAPEAEYSAAQISGYNAVDDANGVETDSQLSSDFALLYLTTPIENAGTFALGTGYTGGTVNVTGFPLSDSPNQETASETVSDDPSNPLLTGNYVLGEGASGGPVWYTTSSGTPEAVGLNVSFDGSTSDAVQLTPSDLQEISQWESTIPTPSPPTPSPLFKMTDNSASNTVTTITADSYNGPLAFLAHGDAFSYNGSDNVQVSALNATNPLIATGSGNDLLTSSATGTSVLDGGTGANIETDGGNGNTTFVQNGYVTGQTWDFVQNFHGGDEDIIFGYIKGISTMTSQQNGGLASDLGATFTVKPGNGNAEEVTFVGASLSSIQGCSAVIDGVPSFILWDK